MRIAPFAFAVPAVFAAVLVAAPAQADIKWNGKMFNGYSLNGIVYNGWSLNGAKLNGTFLNGRAFKGARTNGAAGDAVALVATRITLPSGEVIDLAR